MDVGGDPSFDSRRGALRGRFLASWKYSGVLPQGQDRDRDGVRDRDRDRHVSLSLN